VKRWPAARYLVWIAASTGCVVLILRLDDITTDGNKQAVIAYSACLLLGAIVGRCWLLALPWAVLVAVNVSSAGSGEDPLDAQLIVAAMLGLSADIALAGGVALHRLCHRRFAVVRRARP
jgi:hypothetical protein